MRKTETKQIQLSPNRRCLYCFCTPNWPMFLIEEHSGTYCTPECAAAHDIYCNGGRRIAEITTRCIALNMHVRDIEKPAPLRQELIQFGGSISEIASNWPAHALKQNIEPDILGYRAEFSL